MAHLMKAVVLRGITGARDIALTEIPIPEVRPGWIRIRVKGFGLNHSEKLLRLSEITADYISKPIVPGIECVGIVDDPADSAFHSGQKVMAMMGGMGRNFNGSYAEYVLVPAHHVFPVEAGLSWAELAAIPETCYTAWGSLFTGLRLTPEDTFLIRGATCALGYAAIQLAKALGSSVIATTHRSGKLPLLAAADETILDEGALAPVLSGRGITRVLELVGPSTLRDSLRCLAPGGILCHTGVLGGVFTLDGFDPIKEIPNGVCLTGFFSNTPTPEVIGDMMAFISGHHLRPTIGRRYTFDHIADACTALDQGTVDGKIVVTMD